MKTSIKPVIILLLLISSFSFTMNAKSFHEKTMEECMATDSDSITEANAFYKETGTIFMKNMDCDSLCTVISLLDKAINLSPRMFRAYEFKAQICIRVGEYQQALETLLMEESLGEKHPDLIESIGILYLEQGMCKKQMIILKQPMLWHWIDLIKIQR